MRKHDRKMNVTASSSVIILPPMPIAGVRTRIWHIFLASPGDMGSERERVRRFFEEFSRNVAAKWPQPARFEVLSWETHTTSGVGEPQKRITQMLREYRGSLALVIGLFGRTFGTPTSSHESGTAEEFEFAMQCHFDSKQGAKEGYPEIKWFFQRFEKLDGISIDPHLARREIDQWEKVIKFRKKIMSNPASQIFYREFDADGFDDMLRNDLSPWLNERIRPWHTSEHGSPPLLDEVDTASRTSASRMDLIGGTSLATSTEGNAQVKRLHDRKFRLLAIIGLMLALVAVWYLMHNNDGNRPGRDDVKPGTYSPPRAKSKNGKLAIDETYTTSLDWFTDERYSRRIDFGGYTAQPPPVKEYKIWHHNGQIEVRVRSRLTPALHPGQMKAGYDIWFSGKTQAGEEHDIDVGRISKTHNFDTDTIQTLPDGIFRFDLGGKLDLEYPLTVRMIAVREIDTFSIEVIERP